MCPAGTTPACPGAPPSPAPYRPPPPRWRPPTTTADPPWHGGHDRAGPRRHRPPDPGVAHGTRAAHRRCRCPPRPTPSRGGRAACATAADSARRLLMTLICAAIIAAYAALLDGLADAGAPQPPTKPLRSTSSVPSAGCATRTAGRGHPAVLIARFSSHPGELTPRRPPGHRCRAGTVLVAGPAGDGAAEQQQQQNTGGALHPPPPPPSPGSARRRHDEDPPP